MAGAKLILLVDDDPDFLEVNRLTLEGVGYRVACCFDADHALAKVAEETPDVVVSDLMMRSFDEGFGFVKKLRAEPRTSRVKVILATGVQRQMGGITFRPRTEEERVAMGVDAYLEKPLRPGVLLAKVRELLGERG
jgi:adenylate cyclase